MTYTFSATQPPLMKDFPVILSIPSADLKSQTYVSTEQPNSPIIYNDSQHDHWQTFNSFVISRYQVWRLTTPPFHSASTGIQSHSVTVGYEESKMTQFEKSISATAGASGFGLSASVTATLKLTTEDTKTWSTSTTDGKVLDCKAGYTYAGWTLYEHLEVQTQAWYQYEWKGDEPPGYSKSGELQTSVVEIAIYNYDDSIADPNLQFVPSTLALLSHTGGNLHPA